MPIHKKIQRHKILLDTHIWIWLMLGDAKLNNSFKTAIEQTIEDEHILISAISIWELGMLVERNRIALDRDILEWTEEALNTPGFNLVPLSPRIAIQSTRLPESLHGDPADRILIATAHESNAILVTHDQKLLAYGKGQFIGVCDPTD